MTVLDTAIFPGCGDEDARIKSGQDEKFDMVAFRLKQKGLSDLVPPDGIAPGTLAGVVDGDDTEPRAVLLEEPALLQGFQIELGIGDRFACSHTSAGMTADYGDGIDRRTGDREFLAAQRNIMQLRALA